MLWERAGRLLAGGLRPLSVFGPRRLPDRIRDLPVGGLSTHCAIPRLCFEGGASFFRPPCQERVCTMDWKLELVVIPVSDVDRAKEFYTEKAGFHADHDQRVNDKIRFVQLTPPGSACSIALGEGIVEGTPGSVKGLQVVVSDINAAHAELAQRGVDVSDVQVLDW